MNTDERREAGLLYRCSDPALLSEQRKQIELQNEFNALPSYETEKRNALLQKMMAAFGEGSYIEGSLHANWGGKFCQIGRNVYINFNLTMVDDGAVMIEDNVMIGPNVTIISGSHPNQPQLRKDLWQFTAPVRICDNAWIGAGAIVLPGVKIGKNAVVAAGSVVSRDVPDNCIAAGNPCRVLRPLGEKDEQYYFRDRPVVLDDDCDSE